MATKKRSDRVPSVLIENSDGPTLQEVNFTQAVDFKSFYTNFVQTQYTPFDISFMICEALGVGPDGKQVVQQKARVTMTMSEAKIVSQILTETLKKWEEQFGKIALPALPTT